MTRTKGLVLYFSSNFKWYIFRYKKHSLWHGTSKFIYFHRSSRFQICFDGWSFQNCVAL